MKWLMIVSILILAGCEGFNFGAGQQADFYECPPNNTLKVCVPGTVPAGCENVGSGTTTLPLENC